MTKRKPEDSHRVETEEEKSARKEHERDAHKKGLVATLDAGLMRDLAANLVPAVEGAKTLVAFLEEIGEAIEPDLEIEEVAEEVVPEEAPVMEPEEEIPEVVAETIEEPVDEKAKKIAEIEAMLKELKGE